MNYISKQVQLAPGEWTDVELFLNVTYANNNTQFFIWSFTLISSHMKPARLWIPWVCESFLNKVTCPNMLKPKYTAVQTTSVQPFKSAFCYWIQFFCERKIKELKEIRLPLMATLLLFIEVNTCSSFSSLAMFCTSLMWNSSNSTGTSPAFRKMGRKKKSFLKKNHKST